MEDVSVLKPLAGGEGLGTRTVWQPAGVPGAPAAEQPGSGTAGAQSASTFLDVLLRSLVQRVVILRALLAPCPVPNLALSGVATSCCGRFRSSEVGLKAQPQGAGWTSGAGQPRGLLPQSWMVQSRHI